MAILLRSGQPAISRAAICVLLGVMVCVTFWPVLGNGFTNFDDHEYVTKNPHVRAGLTPASIKWAWTASYSGNWHPLTWMSHMLDWDLFGARAAGHHAVSLLLHLVGTLLLFLVLERMTGAVWRSAFVAALFAVHPLHVESVAWASERKDVLSGVFWMLTTWAYIRAVKSPSPGRRRLVVACFALGLTTKPMLVTLPFTLLLLDYWPLGRWPAGAKLADWRRASWPLVREKLPLFVLAAASSALTFAIQKSGKAVGSLAAYPLSVRIANALVAYVTYLWKTVWPASLAMFYPHRGPNLSVVGAAGAGVVLALITVAAWRTRRRAPYVLVGWLWFLGTLVPVIGLVQVGAQALADRYTYLPLIGLFVIAAWGIPDLWVRLTARGTTTDAPGRVVQAAAWALGGLGAVAILVLAGCARVQAGYWRDSVTLCRHALAATERNYLAHSLLGAALEEEGRLEEAAPEYERALAINPDDPLALNNVGLARAREGRTEEAITLYTRALASDAEDPETNNNLGAALAQQGKIDEAIEHYRTALRRRPDYTDASNNLASALAMSGRLYEAIAQFRQALETAPDSAELHSNLGGALAKSGQLDEAITQFAEAAKLKPDFAQAHFNWGVALSRKGDLEGAAAQFRETIQLEPRHVPAHANLAGVFYRQQRYADAWREIRAVRELGAEPPAALVDALSRRAPDPG